MNEKLKKLMLEILETEKDIQQLSENRDLIIHRGGKWDELDDLVIEDLVEKQHQTTKELRELLNSIYKS